MKRSLFLVLLFVNSLCYAQTPTTEKPKIDWDSLRNASYQQVLGKSFLDFSVSSGKIQWTNAKLKGKVVFINFWFSTCPPCIAELDELDTLYKKFKDSVNFEFISLTYENFKEIQRMKAIHNIKYNVFSITKQECYRLNNSNGFPTSMILDKSGKIQYIHVGGFLNKKEIKEHFTKEVFPFIQKLYNSR